MKKEPWLEFFGTGTLVLPPVLILGTGSIEAFAVSLFALTMIQIMLIIIDPDDPLAERIKPEDDNKD